MLERKSKRQTGAYTPIKTKGPQHNASQRDALISAASTIVSSAADVKIDGERLREIAKEWSSKEMSIPKWDMPPVFLAKADNDTIDFMLLGNAINFAFTDFKTGKKYAAECNGVQYEGAMGMWAALKSAYESGIPILNGEYLSNITMSEAEGIFNKKSQIPMLKERVDILREVGKKLKEKYGGHFYNVVSSSNHRMFDNGGGLVERLVSDFPSFRDSASYRGMEISFSKRAQLAAAMLYEKFLGLGVTLFPDADTKQLTVFADYELPRALRGLGVIKYSDSLQRKVDNDELIQKGSAAEVEIRAATICAAVAIEDEINALRGDAYIGALQIDYLLWSEGRKFKMMKHHLTVTTAY